MTKLEDKIEEYDNLMRAGLDEVAVSDFEVAAEYFSDAAFVLSEIEDDTLKAELINRYEVNPLDYAC